MALWNAGSSALQRHLAMCPGHLPSGATSFTAYGPCGRQARPGPHTVTHVLLVQSLGAQCEGLWCITEGHLSLGMSGKVGMSGTPAPTGSRVIVCLLCLLSLSSCRSGPGSNSFKTGGLTRQEAPLESRAGGWEGSLPTSSHVPAGQDADTPGSSYKKKVFKDKVRSSRSLPALLRLHRPFPLSRPHGPFCSLA